MNVNQMSMWWGQDYLLDEVYFWFTYPNALSLASYSMSNHHAHSDSHVVIYKLNDVKWAACRALSSGNHYLFLIMPILISVYRFIGRALIISLWVYFLFNHKNPIETVFFARETWLRWQQQSIQHFINSISTTIQSSIQETFTLLLNRVPEF